VALPLVIFGEGLHCTVLEVFASIFFRAPLLAFGGKFCHDTLFDLFNIP
jgi:hypothetical protein